MKYILRFVAWLTLCSICLVAKAQNSPSPDRAALVAFYNSTDGPNWANNTNWLQGPISGWFGVEIDNNNRVVGLDLPSNRLGGSVPADLNLLKSLRVLNLRSNSNVKSITPIQNLPSLEVLDLGKMGLPNLPSLDTLPSLKRLLIDGNALTSLQDLSDFTELEELIVFSNNLTSLPDLPPGLQRLSVRVNQLTDLGNAASLANLVELRCQNNRLTFEDLLPFIGLSPNTFSYAPQDSVESEQTYAFYVGDTLEMATPVDVGADTSIRYQWFLQPAGLNNFDNATGVISENKVNITDNNFAGGTATGDFYFVRITSSLLPDLLLTSRKKFIVVRQKPLGFDDTKVPGYIRTTVRFNPNSTDAERDAIRARLLARGAVQDMSRLCNCSTVETWLISDTLRTPEGEVAVIDPEESILEAQEELPPQNDTASIEKDFLVTINEPQPNDLSLLWAVDLELDSLIALQQKDIIVGLIDYGLDSSHSVFDDRIKERKINAQQACRRRNKNSFNFKMDNTNAFQDSLDGGHGTHIGSIIIGLRELENLRLMSLQVGTHKETATLFDIVCAVDYAIKKEVDVLNMSIGYLGDSSSLFDQVMQMALDADIVVVASAGNDSISNDLNPHWPSNFATKYPNILSVASVKSFGQEQISAFSNYGANTVNIAAPGELIWGAIPNRNGVMSHDFAFKSGTSMANGFVTAFAAAIRGADPSLTAPQVVSLIRSDAFSVAQVSAAKVKGGRRLKVNLVNCLQIPQGYNDLLNIAVDGSASINVLENDCFVDSIGIPEVTVEEDFQNGTYTLINGIITYTPNAGFEGIDVLTYKIAYPSNPGNFTTAKVFVKVSANTSVFLGLACWIWVLIALGLIVLLVILILVRRGGSSSP
ncbi:MAG: S8 family serine peptidase [Bacteroidota bacterium]